MFWLDPFALFPMELICFARYLFDSTILERSCLSKPPCEVGRILLASGSADSSAIDTFVCLRLHRTDKAESPDCISSDCCMTEGNPSDFPRQSVFFVDHFEWLANVSER
jgi:hypothetical protein